MSYPRRQRHHLTDHARVCQCGEPMRPAWHSNSGTTQFSQACPVLLDIWRTNNNNPWTGDQPPGHQWVITSKDDHDPNCCSIRELNTVPGEINGLWPFDRPEHQPHTVDLEDQAVRAMLDALGYRATLEDAWERVRRAAATVGITDLGTAEQILNDAWNHAKATADGRSEQHACAEDHRTHRQIALCAYENAYSKPKVSGKGRYAVVSWCAKPTVTLHAHRGAAVKALRRLADYSCGPKCRDRHSIRVLPELPTKSQKAA